jgi:hypothetical protein
MAHFAKLGVGNKVTQVVVVHNNELKDENGIEVEQKGIDFLRELYGEPHAIWIQTSYNNSFRGTFAVVGSSYNSTKDLFILSRPYPSWVLNESTNEWEPPIPKPEGNYNWNESNKAWDEAV